MEGMLHDYKCLETFLKIPQGVKKVNPLYYFLKIILDPVLLYLMKSLYFFVHNILLQLIRPIWIIEKLRDFLSNFRNVFKSR